MTQAVLCLNCGSATVKFTVYAWRTGASELGAALCHGSVQRAATVLKCHFQSSEAVPLRQDEPLGADLAWQQQALALMLHWLESRHGLDLVAVSHRFVHGGTRFTGPALIGAAQLAELEALVPLAPLHQPFNIAGVRACQALRDTLPQIACFDTAFHASQSVLASSFALPRALTAEGLRRYGFHGLSYAYIAAVLPRYLGAAARGRVIVAHLGSGASLCALRDGVSVATTMGFTALDGLMMATRCGTLDPGVVLYLQMTRGLDAAAVSHLLYEQSGLLGVSGISDDMRTLLASPAPQAAEAVALFCYRVVREIGSLAAALGGLDALVFTAGIGENAPSIRQRVGAGCAWLGVQIDEQRNTCSDGRISPDVSGVSAWVIPTDEQQMLGRLALPLLTELRATPGAG